MFTSVPRKRVRSADPPRRRGAILVLATAMIIVILAFTAFSLDIGWISLTKSQMQSAADAAALSAAQELNPMGDQGKVAAAVRKAATDVAAMHRNGEKSQVALDPNSDVTLGRRTWDPNTKKYTYTWGDGATPYNVVKVVAQRSQVTTTGSDGKPQVNDRRLPLFFAPIIGQNKTNVRAEAVATFLPRDMMLVLDYSASMNDDSEFGAFSRLGKSAVEANIQQIWQDLGSPLYGKLPYEPNWVTIPGQPASGMIPHIDLTYMIDEIEVVSTKALSNVVLKFADGTTQKFDGLSGMRAKFKGTGGNNKKRVVTAWIKSGSNSSPDGAGYGERFDITTANIKKGLGLDKVTYPYPAGSWDEFLNYTTYTGNYYEYISNYTAGYHFKFGAKNLVNYWNEYRPGNAETPGLWKARQQPLTALKDSADVFLNFLTEVKADDQVGFTLYTSDDASGAKLESGLTYDYAKIKTLYRERQAGHYDQYTNIGAGLQNARQELEKNSRGKAIRSIILMTDGLPNRPTEATAKQFVLDEAQLCKKGGIKVTTISLGSGADTSLMQQVADVTSGKHFNVPGGSSVSAMEAQLKKVFAEIAADRPMQLIRP